MRSHQNHLTGTRQKTQMAHCVHFWPLPRVSYQQQSTGEVFKIKKIRTALMRIIFRMHKLHTWHSALLRKQHCCLPSPSGSERDTPRVILVLLSLSICLKSRMDSLPSLSLRVFIFASEILVVSGM